MYELLETLRTHFIKIHYGTDQSFSGYLQGIHQDSDLVSLYNEVGTSMIYARVSTITAITAVKERAPTPPSPHYVQNTALKQPEPKRDCFPPLGYRK